MWRLAALFVMLLVGYPLAIAPSKVVAITAGASLALSALGIVVRSTPVLTAALALALGEYTLALSLAGLPPRLGAAVVFGVVVALVLEIGDFDRRFRGVEIGPRVYASQLRYWARFAALGAVAALVLIEAASAITSVMRVPWTPVLAAVGALIALGAGTVALRRARA
jgi:hypothetical protein